MSVTLSPVIRGDGFVRAIVYKENGVPTSVEPFGIRAQVRDSADNLVGELAVTKANQDDSPGLFTIAADPNPPTGWPIDVLACDVEMTLDGLPRSTQRILIPVVADVTRDD